MTKTIGFFSLHVNLYFNKFIDYINRKRKQYVVAQKENTDKYLAFIQFLSVIFKYTSMFSSIMYCFLQHFPPVDLSRNVSIKGTILETLR